MSGERAIEPQNKDLRSYPRILAPKELVVIWRSGDQRGASRLGTVGLVIQVSPGAPAVRTRAVVYNVKPGEGMGVKFVQMRGEDRMRLNQFLHEQVNKSFSETVPVANPENDSR
jgi:hypothetical protein